MVVVVLLCFGFFLFFMKAILSYCDFWTFFVVFFIFLFICALTFHKCQIVMKAILHFLIFGPFFVVFNFSFHFCFDLPQMPNCYESDSFIFIFCPFF